MRRFFAFAATLALFAGPAWAGTVLLSNGGAVATGNPLPVTGTVTQAGNWTVGLNAGANTIGGVTLPDLEGGLAVGTAPAKAIATLGQYNTTAPALATGQTASLQLDSSGNLKVDVASGGGSGGTSSSFGAAFPATGTAIGAEYSSALPTLTAGDMATLQLDASGRLIISPNGVTSAIGSGTSGSLGELVLGAATTAPPAYGSGNNEPFSLDATGNLRVTAQPSATGGWTPITEAALSTTVKTIKGSQGELGTYYCYNPNSTSAVVELFNATSVTLGTTAPAYFIEIPATAAANLSITAGIAFSTAIATAAVTTVNGSTAPATGIDCSFGYN